MPAIEKPSDVRVAITQMLRDGLQTQTEPFPETDKEFAMLLTELRDTPRHDLRRRIVLAGVVDRPHGPDRQRCMECMYFLIHHRWCDLPELAVPVEADWWCRLWRI